MTPHKELVKITREAWQQASEELWRFVRSGIDYVDITPADCGLTIVEDGMVVPREVVVYCRALVSATCRSLAIANESKEYEKARQIRSLLEDADRAMLAAAQEKAK